MQAARVSTSHAAQDVRFWLSYGAFNKEGVMNAASVAPSHTAHALRLWLWWVAATILDWCAELPHSGGWRLAGAVGLLLPVGLACWIWGEPSDLGWLVVALTGGALVVLGGLIGLAVGRAQ